MQKHVQTRAGDAKGGSQLWLEICGTLELAKQREWLVANGIGGFASGTVGGNHTRRYHGLPMATLDPSVGRMQLVAKLDETANYDGADYALATNRWESGAVDPRGYLNIESFRLEYIQCGTSKLQHARGRLAYEHRTLKNGVQVTAFEGATEAVCANVTAHTIRARCGDGCSAHSLRLICACTTIAAQPSASLILGRQVNTTDWARSAKSIDPPLLPGRCIVQASTVGEVLRAWRATVG